MNCYCYTCQKSIILLHMMIRFYHIISPSFHKLLLHHIAIYLFFPPVIRTMQDAVPRKAFPNSPYHIYLPIAEQEETMRAKSMDNF